MDWSEERYVRVYTRDTPDLLAFGFEGRAVWWELIRKVDRAGVLDHGGDLDIVAELLRVPVEVFQVGLERIVKRGSVRLTARAIVIPNLIEAQEADQSDRLRQRESRARRRERALAAGADPSAAKAAARPDYYGGGAPSQDPVTPRDQMGSQGVTNGHAWSRVVTAGHSVPCLAIPNHAVEVDPGGSAAAPPARAARPAPDPDSYAVADRLREAVLAVKPNHRVGEDGSWNQTRRAWARTLAGTLRRRPRPELEAVIAFVQGAAGQPYAFVVESAKALDDKLDRIEAAMVRAREAPARKNGQGQGYYHHDGTERYGDGDIDL